MKSNIDVIVIGGSAGSFGVIIKILKALPKDFKFPIILCLHRLKHVREGFVDVLQLKSQIKVIEPCDKEKIKAGCAYLAPANYHMYIELNKTISLSTEEMVNFSRPSIDLTFNSAGYVYKKKALGIILSGANRDGAHGLQKLKQFGGTTLIQTPLDCRVPTMPKAAKDLTEIDYELETSGIIDFLLKLRK